MVIRSVNPATGEQIERFTEFTPKELDGRLERAIETFAKWRRTSFRERADLLRSAGNLLRAKKRPYGEIMAREMGKPIREGMAETEKCGWVCDYYAENGPQFLADSEVDTEFTRSFVRYEPLGPVLAVMPWNFPFWQVFRFAAPALMAGNVALLKHASNVPRCSLTIQEVFEESGFPKGAFQSLLVGSDKVSALVRDARIRAVTLTGSDRAGASVAEVAGASTKKTVLELGGSDPFIVLRDADVEEAARVAAEARCINSGQSCIAAKRFVVEEAVFENFLERFRREMERRRVGDPLDEGTEIGPQARADLLDDLDRQVRGSIAQGATLELGGKRLDGPGFFYPPTILANVRNGMPAYEEEVFGPVAALARAENEREAVRLANDTRYGLGASIWTQDVDRGLRVAAEIEVGSVFVNRLVKSDPRLPFGGTKASGYGRELGPFGIREFVNVKTVVVA